MTFLDDYYNDDYDEDDDDDVSDDKESMGWPLLTVSCFLVEGVFIERKALISVH